MTTSKLTKSLLDLARKLGRWLLDLLLDLGARHVIGYIWGKVRDFGRRKVKAAKRGNERRVAWLTGRISRWTAAARWLEKNAADVADTVVREATSLATTAKLPLVAEGEDEKKAA